MCLTEEKQEILDNSDPEAVKQATVDELREDDGAKLRALLRSCRESKDEASRALYEKLLRNRALRDLIPH